MKSNRIEEIAPYAQTTARNLISTGYIQLYFTLNSRDRMVRHIAWMSSTAQSFDNEDFRASDYLLKDGQQYSHQDHHTKPMLQIPITEEGIVRNVFTPSRATK